MKDLLAEIHNDKDRRKWQSVDLGRDSPEPIIKLVDTREEFRKEKEKLEKEREARRGVAYGLVVTGLGEGEIMPVETTAVPGSGQLKLTGSLGEVIRI